jgi:FAD binding domain in molybdopterin dehydrogenase
VNLNTITEVRRVTGNGDEDFEWREGDRWLALLRTAAASSPTAGLGRIRLGATCGRRAGSPDISHPHDSSVGCPRSASRVGGRAADPAVLPAFLASFKVWNMATVGGNICMSLPAGPMISLTVALEGIYTIRLQDGGERRVAADEFVTGNHLNTLQPGDLLRSIDLPVAALRKRTCLRRMPLTHLGRSTALLIGTLSPQDGDFMLTVSASTVRPIRLSFDEVPDVRSLRERLRERRGEWSTRRSATTASRPSPTPLAPRSFRNPLVLC